MSTLSQERVQFEATLLALLEGIDGTGTISVSRTAIINYVKAKLDELIPGGEGISFALSASPNISNPLDLLIDAHLDECTKNVIMSAPLTVLQPTAVTSPTGVSYIDTKIGYVILPVNFLRLSSFKMAEWLREVTVPIGMNNPLYRKQSNEYLRGGISKPVAVLKWKSFPTGGLDDLTIAAGGTGFAPGVNILTVVQGANTTGTINCTASAGGVITSINSIVTSGAGYTAANTLAVTGGTGSNCTVNLTAITGMRRILDYYSVDTSHAVESLLYIPETVAEDFVDDNPDLEDALAWACAGKIMQITGQFEPAKFAQERVNQCYINL